MIRHLIKLIWNGKKSNLLLMVEITISFIVLFVVMTIGLENYTTFHQPLGFYRNNVWSVQVYLRDLPVNQAKEAVERIKNRIVSLPETEEISFTMEATPYRPIYTAYERQASYNQTYVQAREWPVDESFMPMLNLQLAEGRWFKKEDDGLRIKPIVINKKFKEALFVNKSALGKVVSVGEEKYTIVGIVEHYRQAENSKEEAGFFKRITTTDTTGGVPQDILVKVKNGTGPLFEEKLMKETSAAIGENGWQLVTTNSLEERRSRYLGTDFTQVLLTVIICVFLIGNVIVGLFGVLWQNVNRRFAEIGVRRAMGATGGIIYRQMVGEVLVLATISIIPGLILAFQFLLFDPFGFGWEAYVWGMMTASLTIYILVTICALYPSWMAAKIQPAMALHEE